MNLFWGKYAPQTCAQTFTPHAQILLKIQNSFFTNAKPNNFYVSFDSNNFWGVCKLFLTKSDWTFTMVHFFGSKLTNLTKRLFPKCIVELHHKIL